MQGPAGGFTFKISSGLRRGVQWTQQALQAAAMPIVASAGPIPRKDCLRVISAMEVISGAGPLKNPFELTVRSRLEDSIQSSWERIFFT
jgi:hypothetical protein